MSRSRSTTLAACVFAVLLAFTGCPWSDDTRGATITVDGQIRSYFIHVPPGYDGKTPVPLVFVLHPFASTGKGIASTTKFSALADDEGFIVVYPNGRTFLWNGDPTDEPNGPPEKRDDVAFIDALLDELVVKYAIDSERVYVTGASNGALMAQRVACELTDRFAAAASVMITLPVGWAQYCQPSGPIPMLLIQGVDDPFFPWEGGTVQEGPLMESEYDSAADMVAFWVANNNASAPPSVEDLPDMDPDDGTTVYRETYAAGVGGAEVIFYGIDGGGHAWPGSTPSLEWLVGTTSQDIDATRVIWQFFQQHSL
ncbi:MAG: prolyl oligopeptidase family serine peptidase [Candidatus Hydrogenedentes bacterium]|nr:prolyl oligopeptidase family serine peptidase [Candidatus Hydrogenedentota bacterium]